MDGTVFGHEEYFSVEDSQRKPQWASKGGIYIGLVNEFL